MVLFASIGFRFRILILVTGLFYTHYLVGGRRPKFTTLLLFFFGTLIIFGIIRSTRSYQTGLNLSSLTVEKVSNSVAHSLGETAVFAVTGALIQTVPKHADYFGYQFIVNILKFPLPSSLIKKETNLHMLNAIRANKHFKQYNSERWGLAILYFGEWYIAFGWYGLIFISFLFGSFYKVIWTVFLKNRESLAHIVLYSILVSLIYVFISRGYFVFGALCFFTFYYPISMLLRINTVQPR
jgi:hypothetical protein